MPLPAIANILRASTNPSISEEGARAYEEMTAVVTAGDPNNLDAELKAVYEATNDLAFPNGVATTQSEMIVILGRREQLVGIFHTIVHRHLIAVATEAPSAPPVT